jgi:glycine/D-amino acid oxidase-like deaminating enzyme
VGTKVDVLIAGAGIAGILTALKLSRAGYSCMLVEPRALVAEQSGHSHGYLHRGYIYFRLEIGIARALQRARLQWEQILGGVKRISPITTESIIGFSSERMAKYAAETWRAAGLPINEAGPSQLPGVVRAAELAATFTTDEPAYNFSDVARKLKDQLNSVLIVKGKVVRLLLAGGSCVSVEVESDGEIRAVTPRFIVLAAGSGIAGILQRTWGYYKAAPHIRTSFMLVLRSSRLTPLSLILPEDRYYGLFMVSRQKRGKTVWLASNFLSFGGICTVKSTSARLWTIATMRTLRAIFPGVMSRDDVEWGIYAAPKAELRPDPERLPEDKIAEQFGLKNVVAVWPTKLTLTPIIASDVVELVRRSIGGPKLELGRESWTPRREPPIALERWTKVSMTSRKDLLRRLGIDRKFIDSRDSDHLSNS